MEQQRVAQVLKAYGLKMAQHARSTTFDFVNMKEHPERESANRLIHENPFAYLLGVIYDQGIPAERAYQYPFILAGRLGGLRPEAIVRMEQTDLDAVFAEKPQLLFWRKASRWTLAAARRVCSSYAGDASAVWLRDAPFPREIESRLREFDGIGQKKASMATNGLYRELGWVQYPAERLRDIDVSFDAHVRRVSLRSGLCDEDTQAAIVAAARRLSPEYPGALDLGAWHVGRQFCSNTNPNCGQCPLSECCAKRTWLVVK